MSRYYTLLITISPSDCPLAESTGDIILGLFLVGVREDIGCAAHLDQLAFKEEGYSEQELYATTYGPAESIYAYSYSHNYAHLIQVRHMMEAVLEYTESDVLHIISHSLGVTMARKAILGGEFIDDDGTIHSLGEPLGERIGIFIGIVLSIIALIMAKKAKSTYEQNPELYKESSYQNMNAGKICAIIGLCLYGLCLIASIIVFLIWGAVFFANMPSNNFF